MCAHSTVPKAQTIPAPYLSTEKSDASNKLNAARNAPTLATLPLRILDFCKRQYKIKTSIVWEWLKVPLGRSDSMVAALFELVASDLMQYKENLFWTRESGIENFQETDIYRFYQEIHQNDSSSAGVAWCPQSCRACLFYDLFQAQDQLLSDNHYRHSLQQISHLYNGYLQEGEISSLWIDFEFVLSQPGGHEMFGRSLPGTGSDYLKCLHQAIDRMRESEGNSGLENESAMMKKGRHNFLRLSRVLATRVLLNGASAWKLTTQHLRLLLTDLVAVSEGTPLSLVPLQGEDGLVRNNPVSWQDDKHGTRIPFDRLLEFFHDWFSRELDTLLFDWAELAKNIQRLGDWMRKEMNMKRQDGASVHIPSNLRHEHENFVLSGFFETSLHVLQLKRDGTATPSELKQVQTTALLLSKFIAEHGSDGVDALRHKYESQEAEAERSPLPELPDTLKIRLQQQFSQLKKQARRSTKLERDNFKAKPQPTWVHVTINGLSEMTRDKERTTKDEIKTATKTETTANEETTTAREHNFMTCAKHNGKGYIPRFGREVHRYNKNLRFFEQLPGMSPNE